MHTAYTPPVRGAKILSVNGDTLAAKLLQKNSRRCSLEVPFQHRGSSLKFHWAAFGLFGGQVWGQTANNRMIRVNTATVAYAAKWLKCRTQPDSAAWANMNPCVFQDRCHPTLSRTQGFLYQALSARMAPIRVNIVGPSNSATSIRASIRAPACHSGLAASLFGNAMMYAAASFRVTSGLPFGVGIGSSKGRFHPR